MSARSVMTSHGFEWRILLGPSHDWPVFKAEPNLIKQQLPAVERCELCRDPIDGSKPFVTNSAGGATYPSRVPERRYRTCRQWTLLKSQNVGTLAVEVFLL